MKARGKVGEHGKEQCKKVGKRRRRKSNKTKEKGCGKRVGRIRASGQTQKRKGSADQTLTERGRTKGKPGQYSERKCTFGKHPGASDAEGLRSGLIKRTVWAEDREKNG